MIALIFHVLVWPTFGIALLVFGFAPGAVLRLIVLAFNRDDPRRRELLAELYGVPRIERPFWVAEQLEIALFEGLRNRLVVRRVKRTPAAQVERVIAPLTRPPETHKNLIARIPRVTGFDLREWFVRLESGPAFLRCEERARWLAGNYGISNGYANAIVHEYEFRRRIHLRDYPEAG